MHSRLGITIALACTALSTTLDADDWPEWRGAGRQAVWAEDGIVDRFPSGGLNVTWRTPIQGGFAGPVVADGRVFVTDFAFLPETKVMDGTERILALDEGTGDVLWTHDWPAAYRNLQLSYATGPRATPTVDGDRVYVAGAGGMLLCLEAATGRVVWSHDAVAEYDTTIPVWGVASAPLVEGDLVIYIVGGEPDALVVAFDKQTGAEVWRAIDVVMEMGYGQPIIYEAGGVRQLIIWHPNAVSSLNPATGEVYWDEAWDVQGSMTVTTPVKSDNYLFFTQFYGGSLMLRLDTDRPAATKLWQVAGSSEMPDGTAALHSLITTPIVRGRLHLRRRQLWRAARSGCHDRRSPVGERPDDGAASLGRCVYGAAWRPVLREQRRRRSHPRAVHAGRVCRARSDEADRGDVARGLWPTPVRRPGGQLDAPGLREPSHHHAQRQRDHSCVARRG